MFHKSNLIKWKNTDPCPSDYLTPFQYPYTRISAVGTVVSVVSKHEILIISQFNWIGRNVIARLLHDFRPEMFIQFFSIDINISILYLYSLSRHTDNSLNIIGILRMLIWEHNHIVTARVTEPVAQLIDDQVVSMA